MAKRAKMPDIRVGDCVVMRADHAKFLSYGRKDPGKVTAKERDVLHVKFYGDVKPKLFNQAIFKLAACPHWLAGTRKRRRRS